MGSVFLSFQLQSAIPTPWGGRGGGGKAGGTHTSPTAFLDELSGLGKKTRGCKLDRGGRGGGEIASPKRAAQSAQEDPIHSGPRFYPENINDYKKTYHHPKKTNFFRRRHK